MISPLTDALSNTEGVIFDRIQVQTGGPGGNRTPDALLRTEALYPLSYEAG